MCINAMKIFASPFEILGNSDTNDVIVQIGSGGESSFALTDIAVIMRTVIYGGAAVTSLVSLSILLLVRNNSKLLSEKKAALMHKLLIVWLASSAVTIFNILKGLLDGLFGFA